MGKKLLVVKEVNGTIHEIKEVSEVYRTFQLNEPNMNIPVISMELRECISRYGIVRKIETPENFNMVKFIPPYQIESVFLAVSPTGEDLDSKKTTAFVKRR